jgi:N-methylhydantoinase A
MGPKGELTALDEESLREAVAAVAGAEVDAVAVCLLFSFLHPEHERRVGEALREALGDVLVSLSCDVLPEFREYERMATTVADAYLAPRLSAYLERLAGRAEEVGLPAPLVMQSSGGVVEVAVAAERAAGCVLSGPAGGVVGAAYAARASGFEDVLTFDMGGTSTDVAPILGGEAQTTTESVVAGVPIKLPMVDVHTVSAGGGSIAWADAGGALRVGPRSAGGRRAGRPDDATKDALRDALPEFAESVDALQADDEATVAEPVRRYLRALSRGANDKTRRGERHQALLAYLNHPG